MTVGIDGTSIVEKHDSQSITDGESAERLSSVVLRLTDSREDLSTVLTGGV